MTIAFRILITVVFGLPWWCVYNRVGVGLQYLMILGSVLAICVCCCRGSSDPGGWNWQRYFACIRRCRLPTAILIVSLFIIGVLAVFIATGAAPAGVVLVNILLAAIFAPLLVWFIRCAYENP